MLGGKVVQNAYVVNDLAKAVDQWVDGIGAGPFFECSVTFPVTYRGGDGTVDMTFAAGQAGPVQIELIKINGTSPNVYTDTYPLGSDGGFHHIAMFENDIDAALRAHEALGHPMVSEFYFRSTRVVYIDARKDLGCMVELYGEGEDLRAVYKTVAAAAQGWDGRDRLRPLVL